MSCKDALFINIKRSVLDRIEKKEKSVNMRIKYNSGIVIAASKIRTIPRIDWVNSAVLVAHRNLSRYWIIINLKNNPSTKQIEIFVKSKWILKYSIYFPFALTIIVCDFESFENIFSDFLSVFVSVFFSSLVFDVIFSL